MKIHKIEYSKINWYFLTSKKDLEKCAERIIAVDLFCVPDWSLVNIFLSSVYF